MEKMMNMAAAPEKPREEKKGILQRLKNSPLTKYLLAGAITVSAAETAKAQIPHVSMEELHQTLEAVLARLDDTSQLTQSNSEYQLWGQNDVRIHQEIRDGDLSTPLNQTDLVLDYQTLEGYDIDFSMVRHVVTHDNFEGAELQGENDISEHSRILRRVMNPQEPVSEGSVHAAGTGDSEQESVYIALSHLAQEEGVASELAQRMYVEGAGGGERLLAHERSAHVIISGFHVDSVQQTPDGHYTAQVSGHVEDMAPRAE